MGSVRYFFSTQDELLQFALREVVDAAAQRIQTGAECRASAVPEGRSVAAAVSLLEEVLPLDDERLVEARVYAAFTVPGAAVPDMVAIRRQADDGLRRLCHDCLAGLRELGHVDPSRDLEVESERLWSLLDGLTMHILLDPIRLPAHRVDIVLRTHLSDLSTAVTATSARP